MSRKVYVTAKVNLVLRVEEGTNVDDVLSSLVVQHPTEEADVEDFSIVESEVTDSK